MIYVIGTHTFDRDSSSIFFFLSISSTLSGVLFVAGEGKLRFSTGRGSGGGGGGGCGKSDGGGGGGGGGAKAMLRGEDDGGEEGAMRNPQCGLTYICFGDDQNRRSFDLDRIYPNSHSWKINFSSSRFFHLYLYYYNFCTFVFYPPESGIPVT
jgi:hypothetical protein